MNVQLCGCIFILHLHLLLLSGTNSSKLRPPSASLQARSEPSVSVSGELTTEGGHRCSWQTSGDSLVSLLVNCTSLARQPQSYWCRFAGKPHLCPAEGVKLIRYWKQLVGRLKKRQNACEGEKVLRVKTCKKVTDEAHMKLTHRSDEEVRKSKKNGPQRGGEVKVEVMTMSMSEGRAKTDLEPVQRFCSQGWSSVCSFFLTLLQAPGSS